jgi:vacuolar-type H+-ATPase subunit E/Vma4
MNTPEEQARQQKNADVIMAAIKEESGQEAARILAAAKAEADTISKDASAEGERVRAQARAALQQELAKMREQIFSSVSLDKKRIILEEKNTFIQEVLRSVRELSSQFRKNPGYEDFLRNAVVEGAVVVGAAKLEIAYAIPDENLFRTATFTASLEPACQNAVKRAVAFTFTKGDFNDPGVIISSVDGRILFDNRLSSRLARREGEIYERLLKDF